MIMFRVVQRNSRMNKKLCIIQQKKPEADAQRNFKKKENMC